MARGLGWRQKERSNGFMLWLLISLTRLLGSWVGRLLLFPIVSWYWLFAPAARSSSRQFLAKASAGKRLYSWKHLYCFAASLLDRVLLYSNNSERFKVSLHGEQHVLPHLAQGRGVLLLLSHLGSFEMIRVRGAELGRPIKVLMDKSQGQKLLAALEAINPSISDDIIDTGVSDTDRVLRVKKALDEGYLVCMMADRCYGGDSAAVDFFDRPAQLPLSPYLMASVLKVPVVLGFAVRESVNAYRIEFEPLAEQMRLPRKMRTQAAQGYAQQYAARLQFWAQRHPYNWFNFYDFWAEPDVAATQELEP